MPNKFLPKIFINSDVGVTTAKKTIPITNGETTLPSKIPNLYQTLFNGVKIREFSKPRIKKNIASITDHTLIFPSFNNGQNEIIRNTVKKTIPKLRFEGKLFFNI